MIFLLAFRLRPLRLTLRSLRETYRIKVLQVMLTQSGNLATISQELRFLHF